MSTQELKWAQKSLYNGGKQIADAGMRLQGSRFENDYKRIWEAISNLNSSLIAEVKRK